MSDSLLNRPRRRGELQPQSPASPPILPPPILTIADMPSPPLEKTLSNASTAPLDATPSVLSIKQMALQRLQLVKERLTEVQKRALKRPTKDPRPSTRKATVTVKTVSAHTVTMPGFDQDGQEVDMEMTAHHDFIVPKSTLDQLEQPKAAAAAFLQRVKATEGNILDPRLLAECPEFLVELMTPYTQGKTAPSKKEAVTVTSTKSVAKKAATVSKPSRTPRSKAIIKLTSVVEGLQERINLLTSINQRLEQPGDMSVLTMSLNTLSSSTQVEDAILKVLQCFAVDSVPSSVKDDRIQPASTFETVMFLEEAQNFLANDALKKLCEQDRASFSSLTMPVFHSLKDNQRLYALPFLTVNDRYPVLQTPGQTPVPVKGALKSALMVFDVPRLLQHGRRMMLRLVEFLKPYGAALPEAYRSADDDGEDTLMIPVPVFALLSMCELGLSVVTNQGAIKPWVSPITEGQNQLFQRGKSYDVDLLAQLVLQELCRLNGKEFDSRKLRFMNVLRDTRWSVTDHSLKLVTDDPASDPKARPFFVADSPKKPQVAALTLLELCRKLAIMNCSASREFNSLGLFLAVLSAMQPKLVNKAGKPLTLYMHLQTTISQFRRRSEKSKASGKRKRKRATGGATAKAAKAAKPAKKAKAATKKASSSTKKTVRGPTKSGKVTKTKTQKPEPTPMEVDESPEEEEEEEDDGVQAEEVDASSDVGSAAEEDPHDEVDDGDAVSDDGDDDGDGDEDGDDDDDDDEDDGEENDEDDD